MSDVSRPAVGSLDEEIVRSEVAWGRLLSAIGRVPIDRTDEPGVCGQWSLKTLLGHITFWDQFETDHIAHRASLDEPDWDAINAGHEQLVQSRTFHEVLAEMKETHERFMAHVATLPHLDPARFRELAHDHYVEHCAEIERWLAAELS